MEKDLTEYSKKKLENLINSWKNKHNNFNLFSVLKLEEYEIRHSNFLAWLLDPKETHGIDDTFLRFFIEIYNEKNTKKIVYEKGLKSIKVYREKDNIDILVVDDDNNNVIVIENKINALIHDNQLERYSDKVNEYKDYHKYFIYLKPEIVANEICDKDKYWIPITYESIIDKLKNIPHYKLNADVKMFIDQYIKIFDNRYEKIGNQSLKDICLMYEKKCIDENEEINSDIKEIIEEKHNFRRREIQEIFVNVIQEKYNENFDTCGIWGNQVEFFPKGIIFEDENSQEDKNGRYHIEHNGNKKPMLYFLLDNHSDKNCFRFVTRLFYVDDNEENNEKLKIRNEIGEIIKNANDKNYRNYEKNQNIVVINDVISEKNYQDIFYELKAEKTNEKLEEKFENLYKQNLCNINKVISEYINNHS